MTRTMYDSIHASAIPSIPMPDMVAGYIDGEWPDYTTLKSLFPDAVALDIAVFVAQDARALDIENGDATPAQAPAWVTRQRSRGVEPICYCNLNTYPSVLAEFQKQNVHIPMWWIAYYDNQAIWNLPNIPNLVAKQYGGVTNQYDLSIVIDNIPGLDGDLMTQPQVTDIYNQLKAINDAIANGTAPGTVNMGETIKSTLETVQGEYNKLNSLAVTIASQQAELTSMQTELQNTLTAAQETLTAVQEIQAAQTAAGFYTVNGNLVLTLSPTPTPPTTGGTA